ncbi:tetratricopeptide repeat-containing diguanylate cyclase [Litorilituus lipolyticus]|nr:tetratricopeptide repeat-containing diguanylate cyclase [Litorilituus lipolyticus]
MIDRVHESCLSNLKYFQLFIISCITYFIFSMPSYAEEEHSSWIKAPFQQLDEFNKKDPAIALDFAEKLYAKSSSKMNNAEKATLFAKMALYCSYLGKLEQSQEYVDTANTFKPKPNSTTGISLLLTQATLLDSLGKAKEAMLLYKQAEQRSLDSENLKSLADSYSYIASSYSLNHNDIEAIKYFNKGYHLFEQLGDDLEIAYMKIQMSTSYSLLYDDEQAIRFANEALEYFLIHELFFDALFAQNALAYNYLRKKSYELAKEAFYQVIELSKKVNTEDYEPGAYLGLAKVFLQSEKNEKARYYFNKYQRYKTLGNTPYEKIDHLLVKAELELNDEKLELAEQALSKVETTLIGIEKENALSVYRQLYDLKAKLATFQDDYKTAYNLQSQARDIQSNYSNSEREKIRSKMKIIFDTDQALLKNKLLEQEKQLNDIALENAQNKQWLQNLVIAIISTLTLLLAYFVYRQLKTSQSLQMLANTDSLTGLANRRFAFNQAEKYLAYAKKTKKDFSIIMFDIDFFKQVNDEYGHTAGDVALKELAILACGFVRANDIIGRIGGEEFLIVLPTASSKQAAIIAERIRAATEEQSFTANNTEIKITASFGVSQLTSKEETFSEIFHNADVALYQAKEHGRNKVVLA